MEPRDPFILCHAHISEKPSARGNRNKHRCPLVVDTCLQVCRQRMAEIRSLHVHVMHMFWSVRSAYILKCLTVDSS